MTQISLETPELLKPDKTEDPKIITCFTTIQTAINGNLDSTNLKPASVTGESLDPTVTGRRLVERGAGWLGEGTASGAYLFSGAASGGMRVAGGGNASSFALCLLEPTKFAITGKANTLIQIIGTVATNSTAPATTFGLALCPVTALTGAKEIAVTIGASVLSSALAVTPAAGSTTAMESATAACPTGVHALIATCSGTMVANSLILINASLYVLNT